MAEVRIRWTGRALADLKAIGEFIERDSPRYARITEDRLLAAVDRLEDFPRSGRMVPEIQREEIREVIVGNYRIVYSLGIGEVDVLTVFHAARDFGPADLPGRSAE